MKNCKALLLAGLFSLVAFLPSCKKESNQQSNAVVVWHWMTDREEAFNEITKRYKTETGKEVQFQLYAPSDLYSQKVEVGAQTNSLPEIYGILGDSSNLAKFVEAGHVENLSTQLEADQESWKNSFYPEAINTAYFKEGNQFNVPSGFYGIPIDVTTIPMIYNKNLFKKAGLDPETPPATWKEFLEAGKKLKAIGVNGFVSGWSETWLIYSLVTDFAHNLMGAEKVMDTFRGKVSYTDPDWITVLKVFEDLRKANIADPGLVTLQNKNSEQSFSSERSAITFNGSWGVNVYSGMNASLEYAPFRPPRLGDKFPQTVWGGAGSVFYVNAKSARKEAAVDFLKWLSQKEQASYLASATKNLPAVKDAEIKDSPVLMLFANLMKDSIHPNRFEVTEAPKVQEALTKGIQSILIGEKTAEEIAKAVQKAKEKALKDK
ncbi:MAG: extracellular solute-binding protein [Elusimicrobiota bacterium]